MYYIKRACTRVLLSQGISFLILQLDTFDAEGYKMSNIKNAHICVSSWLEVSLLILTTTGYVLDTF